MSETKTLALSPEDLKNMVAAAVTAAVAESRKVIETEAETANKKQAVKDRAEQAKLVLKTIEEKRFGQTVCSHKHSARDQYRSHCVWIQDGNYILCQKCQGKIRPAVAKEQQTDKQAIYDTALFNELFQECYEAQ